MRSRRPLTPALSSTTPVRRAFAGPLPQPTGPRHGLHVTGVATPDGNGTFVALAAPAINHAGRLVLVAYLTGTCGGRARIRSGRATMNTTGINATGGGTRADDGVVGARSVSQVITSDEDAASAAQTRSRKAFPGPWCKARQGRSRVAWR